LASKGREVGLYDFTIYDVIRRNSRCFKERPAWVEVSDGRIVTFAEVRDLPLLDENGLPDRGKAKDLYGQEIGKH
jgi:hypothetical protein